jgi:hypothetical protein
MGKIEPRYQVNKISDTTGKHNECRYFVLDPVHDKHARMAIYSYAASVARDDEELARELEEWIMNLNV